MTLLSGDVKTTLLLDICPSLKLESPSSSTAVSNGIDIHTATIFESKGESSVFYQRQVDDVIVVNSRKTNNPESAQKQARSEILPRQQPTSSNGLFQASSFSSKALIEGQQSIKSSVNGGVASLSENVSQLKPPISSSSPPIERQNNSSIAAKS